MAECVPIKRRRSSNEIKWDKCLCHVKIDSDDQLTKFTAVSWSKFKESAEVRKDKIWLDVRDFLDEEPKGYYHRQCYQKYTNLIDIKRSENAVSMQNMTLNPENDTTYSDARLSRSMVEAFNKEKCIVCQQDKFSKKHNQPKTREKLVQNISDQGSSALLKAARIRNDRRVLMEIEGVDTKALRIKYHQSCYKEYVRRETLAKLLGETKYGLDDDSSQQYNTAFQDVIQYVNHEIIFNENIVSMSVLLEMFMERLRQLGITDSAYRSSKLKQRLIRTFGDSLSFHQPCAVNQSELVFYTTIKKGEIVESVYSVAVQNINNPDIPLDDCTDSGHDGDASSISSEVFHVAKTLRKALLEVKSTMQWPPTLKDLDTDEEMVPDLVYNMLAWMLTDKIEYSEERVKDVPSDVERIILSMSQDMIHTVSRGRVKTPKHVVLPSTVKSLTGNSEVLTLLNRFGHGLSYSQIEELETAIAEQQIEKHNQGISLPLECIQGIPAVFCWDNNDLQEETLSGKGTTHCTNGIVIQRKIHTCAPPPVTSDVQPRSKRRSITGIQTDIIPYHSGQRQGPSSVTVDVNETLKIDTNVDTCARLLDFGWLLCRMSMQDTLFDDVQQQQQIPSWTAFNVAFQGPNMQRECQIGYCPVVESSPTEMSTVFTVLRNTMDMADQLGQEDVIIVFDLAIYAKALEIIWQNEQEFKRLVVRMGTFHVTCAYLAAIGKRFGDAGLSDILIESGVLASGSVAGVLEGRHYNRAVRMHKVVFEALHRTLWACFGVWLREHNERSNFVHLVEAVKNVRTSFSQESFKGLTSSDEFKEVFNLFNTFCNEDTGPMKKFWLSYLEMVHLLLNLIRATREGDWNLHLNSIKRMIPWFYAYDHINYSRYLPVYLMDMIRLPETNPCAHVMLKNGDFGVQRTTDNGFAQVPVDQTIEQTLNRSTKTKGGIVGFSLKKGAVQRWMMTAHTRAQYVDKCREMTTGDNHNQSTQHKEAGTSRMQRDESDVRKVISVICSLRNPFEPSDELVNLSSGFVATDEVRDDLLKAKDQGQTAADDFMKKRLLSTTTGFFEPISKMKLGTFAEHRKRSSISTAKAKNIIIQADRNLFARLLVIGQSRKVCLRELLSYELGPIPWSLASCDGSLAKTNKANLPKILEDGVCQLSSLPVDTSAVLIDAMAMLQMIVKVPDRFGDLCELVLSGVVKQSGNASRVDFVADQYPSPSIKNMERQKRGKEGELKVNISSPDQSCPRQWKRFMANGDNKTHLLNFIASEWSTNPRYTPMIGSRTIFVTHGSLCTRITTEHGVTVATSINELASSQEEADTRLFLHASHASRSGHRKIAIKSSDTDVEVLACYHQRSISAQLCIISGTKSRSRLIDVASICDHHGQEVCELLPSLHAITGCDTVSTFVGRGKKKALDIVRENPRMRENLSLIGESVPMADEHLQAVQPFVCLLYGDKYSSRVNDTRYNLFCKSPSLQSHQIPPTESALQQHLLRANYQAYIWRNALSSNIQIQEPNGNGWINADGRLEICWTKLPPAPDAVMELVSCSCKGKCSTRRCSCVKNELPCTEACLCHDCENSASNNDDSAEDSSSDED